MGGDEREVQGQIQRGRLNQNFSPGESNMSDLRNKIIKLAYNKPELRDELLPLVQKTAVGTHPGHDGMAGYLEEQVEDAGFRVDRISYVQTAGDTQEDLGVERLRVETYKGPVFYIEYEMVEGPNPYEPEQTNRKLLDSQGKVLSNLKSFRDLSDAIRKSL